MDLATRTEVKIGDITMISAEDLHDRVSGYENFVLVDVRAPSELADSHIDDAGEPAWFPLLRGDLFNN